MAKNNLANSDGESEIPQPVKARDYVAEIGGNFNLHNATALFGSGGAIKALQTYAQFGGHGVFDEHELKSSLFGGLGAPGMDAAGAERSAKINAALNDLK